MKIPSRIQGTEKDSVEIFSSRQRSRLREICGPLIRFDENMARHTTLRAGGAAAAFAEMEDERSLLALLDFCREQNVRWRVIGRGSNLLVRDEGFAGILIRLAGKLAGIGSDSGSGESILWVGGGCSLGRLLAHCLRHSLGGLEFLTGIPGSAGGAVMMNAGAFGETVGEWVERLHLIDTAGDRQEVMACECGFGYRTLKLPRRFRPSPLLLRVGFRTVDRSREEMERRIRAYHERRQRVQPRAVASAGSFFKNPPGEFAGRLIEAAGLKGTRVGGAMVSPVHANFIVNATGTASAADILELMALVQEKVAEQTGIFLEPEVHIL